MEEGTDRIMNAAIMMENVQKRFRGSQALQGVHWSVPEGSIYGLMGANGAGKTTLLRLALGVVWPDVGEIRVLGEVLGRDNAEVRQRVHYVASGRQLPPSFRVEEWIRYSSLLYRNWDKRMCSKLMRALAIDGHRQIGHLSQGMQVGFQIAVAIAARPELLLLDEPTNGLDLVVKQQVLRLIMDSAAETGTTVVMATHNIDDIERMADAVGLLYAGRFLLQDSLDAMKSRLHGLQVVMPTGIWPAEILDDPSIMRMEQQGQVASMVIEGSGEALSRRMMAAGASVIEPIEIDLADVFRSVLHKEGYSRDSIRWDDC